MESWKQAALDFISTCSFRDELKRAYTKETPDFTMQYFRFVSNAFENTHATFVRQFQVITKCTDD